MRYAGYITYRRPVRWQNRPWIQRRALRVNALAVVRSQNGYILPLFRGHI